MAYGERSDPSASSGSFNEFRLMVCDSFGPVMLCNLVPHLHKNGPNAIRRFGGCHPDVRSGSFSSIAFISWSISANVIYS